MSRRPDNTARITAFDTTPAERHDTESGCALPDDAHDIARMQISSLLDSMFYEPVTERPERHECYGYALRFFADHAQVLPSVGPGARRIVALCHGFPAIANGPDEGAVFGHAWVEVADIVPVPAAMQAAGFPEHIQHIACWDGSTGTMMPLALYYAMGRIDPDYVERWTDPVEVFDRLNENGTPRCEAGLAGHIGNWADYADLDPQPVWNDDEE